LAERFPHFTCESACLLTIVGSDYAGTFDCQYYAATMPNGNRGPWTFGDVPWVWLKDQAYISLPSFTFDGHAPQVGSYKLGSGLSIPTGEIGTHRADVELPVVWEIDPSSAVFTFQVLTACGKSGTDLVADGVVTATYVPCVVSPGMRACGPDATSGISPAFVTATFHRIPY